MASIDVAAMPTGATFEEHPRGPLRAAIDVSLPCHGAPVAGRPPAARASRSEELAARYVGVED
ncbi:hypothetical protein GCM10022267_10750 [Lentzea roselyniae]|uniref:Uncharacterized protein n=1 Tax=Lentzea roselyniae TaxID=531940 RepID=A0ABP7A7I5_9PSEU